MTIAPGPGEPADRPGGFAEPVEAWIKAGTDQWWKIAVLNLPPRGDRGRKRVYDMLHAAWKREMDAHGLTTGRDGDYSASLEHDGVNDVWTWGPKGREAS